MKNIRLVLLLCSLQQAVFAQATAYDYILEQQRAPKEKEIAMTYAVAIVVAGALIGLGVYCGIRRSKKDKE
ncbi:MAG: hypothetical protein EXS32_10090 [Opitutus sp.]|nr:hypothetical protein [Opitutus sp.]